MEYIDTKMKPKSPTELCDLIKDTNDIFEEIQNIPSVYLLSTSLIDKKTDLPILKLGYSDNPASRRICLENEYGCNMYPIDIIPNRSLKSEKIMHKFIKLNIKNCNYECKINNANRMELYLYCEELIKYFNECKNVLPEEKRCTNICIDTNTKLNTESNIKSNKKVTKSKKKHIYNNISLLYICEYCNSDFTTKQSLIRHKKTICFKNNFIINPEIHGLQKK